MVTNPPRFCRWILPNVKPSRGRLTPHPRRTSQGDRLASLSIRDVPLFDSDAGSFPGSWEIVAAAKTIRDGARESGTGQENPRLDERPSDRRQSDPVLHLNELRVNSTS